MSYSNIPPLPSFLPGCSQMLPTGPSGTQVEILTYPMTTVKFTRNFLRIMQNCMQAIDKRKCSQSIDETSGS